MQGKNAAPCSAPKEDVLADKTTKKSAKKATRKKASAKKAAKKDAKPAARKAGKKKAAKKASKKAAKKPAKRSYARNLVVVESPAKAKTIKRFLGRGFTIKASMGHVRDIPSRGRGKKAFGVDFENGYAPTYETIKGREKVLNDLAAAAKKAEEVYLAPDPDREGEAIAWHVQEVLRDKAGLSLDQVRRVTFNSITRKAVKEAIDSPRQIDMNLVNAQQGRRILDRLVGYSLSPFLWRKVTKGLSAGRVQSVAVRMVVEREKEIRAFEPQEFWRLLVEVSPHEGEETSRKFAASLVSWDGSKFVVGEEVASTEKSVSAIAETLKKAEYRVQSVEEKETKGRPGPPFITSTLQQAASTFLRYNTSRTMRIAQSLYEGVAMEEGLTGLITYMRTDSTRIAPEALDIARDYIKAHHPDCLPEKPQVYRSKKGAQDAHEAIRPTDPSLTPDLAKPFLNNDQYKLYDLIWRRFMASQMKPAVYRVTTIRIAADRGILEAKGRRMIFEGCSVLGFDRFRNKKKSKENSEEEETGKTSGLPDESQFLPHLTAEDRLDLEKLSTSQHFTQPPPRYSEASLVRALEKEGIGRPSTYAPIVRTIQDRGYVRQEKRRFFATELGIAVTEILLEHFPGIMDLKFTAGMEENLDHVEEGEVNWVELVDQFYRPFAARVETAIAEAESLKGKPAPGGETCPLCEAGMVIRYSQRGAFLGCEKYPDCRGTRSMPGEEGEAGSSEEEDGEPILCPNCQAPMLKRRSRFGVFLGCSGYPECKTTMSVGRDGKPIKLPDIKHDCEKCGKTMQVKASGKSFYLTCSTKGCKNTKPIDKDGKVVDLPDLEDEVCDKCGAEMVLRVSRRGPFIACSAYPKCRNTKPLPKAEDKAEDKEEADTRATAKK